MPYYSPFQSAPDPRFDPRMFAPRMGVDMGLAGRQLSPLSAPPPSMMGGAPGRGGWAGALDTVRGGLGRVGDFITPASVSARGELGRVGDFITPDGMSGYEKAYLGLSAVGGIADYFERRRQRQDEQRRYEQALEEARRHRAMMGANWNRANRAMGGVP